MTTDLGSSGPQIGWYVWVFKPGTFEIVKKYLNIKVPEVKSVLCPTVTTEKKLVNGSKKKINSLYASYIFLQYIHDEKSPHTWQKINKHPFITQYVGPCSAKELASVDSLQRLDGDPVGTVEKFKVGDTVKINSGIFSGCEGTIKNLSGKLVKIVLLDKANLEIVFSPGDLDKA